MVIYNYFFYIPLVIIMSVIHPIQTIMVMLFLKKEKPRKYQQFLSFEDSRTLTFVLIPLLPYFISIGSITLLPVLGLTIFLFIVKQLSWFVYYYKEFGNYMKDKNLEV